jgi:hypothetical protein
MYLCHHAPRKQHVNKLCNRSKYSRLISWITRAPEIMIIDVFINDITFLTDQDSSLNTFHYTNACSHLPCIVAAMP